MEELAAEVLSDDYSLAWTGSAFQENKPAAPPPGVCVCPGDGVLILAAQYERWNLPIAVLLAVPFAVFGPSAPTGCAAWPMMCTSRLPGDADWPGGEKTPS